MPLKPGMKPVEVAELFYKHLMENNREAWLETFTAWHRDHADVGGSSPQLYWTAGRKHVDQLGYSYKLYKPSIFEKARLMAKAAEEMSRGHDPRRPQSKHQEKIFFQRYTRTGEKTGYPLPIVLVRDPDSADEWRVDFATV
ncbi:MAG: hypothetical protein ACFFDP_09905 [Promethearchaeota archaeon]